MNAAAESQTRSGIGWARRALWVALFALAFGYVEASVVVYLRVIYDPLRASVYPDRPEGSLLPLITLDALREADPAHSGRLLIELGRELATMIMLTAIASLAARARGEWLAMFMICFGLWDLAYYVGLKAMIGFPQSLMTWDILFLVPVPWLAPVLAPVLVALSMIAAGVLMLAETQRGRPLRARWFHWAGIVAGGLTIIVSFCFDAGQTMAGEMPQPFRWGLFAVGEAVGLLAFAHAMYRTRHLAS